MQPLEENRPRTLIIQLTKVKVKVEVKVKRSLFSPLNHDTIVEQHHTLSF